MLSIIYSLYNYAIIYIMYLHDAVHAQIMLVMLSQPRVVFLFVLCNFLCGS